MDSPGGGLHSLSAYWFIGVPKESAGGAGTPSVLEYQANLLRLCVWGVDPAITRVLHKSALERAISDFKNTYISCGRGLAQKPSSDFTPLPYQTRK